VTVVASDGFSRTLDLSVPRFYFPEIAEDDDADAEPVSAILALKSALALAPEIPGVDDMVDDNLRSFIGQQEVADINNPFFVNNVNKLVVGDAITQPTFNMLGKELTRADILLLPRAAHTHTRLTSSGETDSIEVRGVPLSALLAEYNDNDVIAFSTVDNWNRIVEYTMTKAELIARNAILAYETKSGDDWTAYYRSTNDGPGFVRLWIDNMQGVHAVNSIRVLFNDIAGYEWAVDAVVALAQNRITTGVAPGLFAPEAPLTRGMFVAFLGRALNPSAVEGSPVENQEFSDVDYNEYYGVHIAWANGLGIVGGVGGGLFSPNGNLTIEQMIKIAVLARFPDAVSPEDEAAAEHWALPYIEVAAENDMLLIGQFASIDDDGNVVVDQRYALRAEAAYMLFALMQAAAGE